ncbi:uncharacterized protein NECHADRAFT_35371 [Fusarium vanettenii 77-13-4]|uniref:Protein kinase domain-containing protein n=1 Tax=Fusarium vanettenii (strain ATCC MYA-4622 / CBS 123669 / FGSC 9596 / NRRL 45880 / 77-13-4) TaxID=660122 RepID=C7YN14_FUSV7|nr:uncharacterized protein NECHADRAFT_35371 [Fusarium vanettenii 77-13-4]EEU47048.1 hypothetical protein NECHADRAFT_35371 [Fusarium vanettenii 77-13-4]
MEEIERLREQPREDPRIREAAEGRALEEQRRSEEAKEIERLREQLREVQRLRKKEERLREAAEVRAIEGRRQREEDQRIYEEERQRRQEVEECIAASRLSTPQQYLEACHSLGLALKIITDRPLTELEPEDTTNPAGRICPRRIIPWTTFAREQEKVWDKLSFSPSFSSQATFPSRHQLDYVKSLLSPVSCEMGLRISQRDVVENAAQILVDATYNDSSLRSYLSLGGTVAFDVHTNLEVTDDSLSESIEQASAQRRRKARGKGNREAGQFCVYQRSSGQTIPAVAIKYKAPHELRRGEIVTGLASEIQPDRDMINQEGEGYEFASRRLTTAVVTELFSYMIGKGTQYGYVCTGEVYVFLYIPDDPSCVYYSICVPSLDVQGDDETRLYRTAVAQVFAFLLQAIQSPPPCQAWHDAAECLDTWAIEYDDVLRSTPETDRRPRHDTPYQAQRWKGFTRSAMSSEVQGQDGNAASQERTSMRPNIRDRLYCTQGCLRGLAISGPMDENCPNFADHGNMHITPGEFLRLARDQLAVDRGKDADCVPLYLSGSRGSLFKFRLSSHGYTLVAKGVEIMDTKHLRHENKMYIHLRDIQGEFIPVCLGVIGLVKPYYFNSGVYKDFMFLSYGGQPVLKEFKEVSIDMANEILTALGRLHQHGVLHCDAEPRNVLYDEYTGRCVMVDLMLAKFHARQPLGTIKVNNSRNQKRKSGSGKQEKDVFAIEAQSLRASLRRRRGPA